MEKNGYLGNIIVIIIGAVFIGSGFFSLFIGRTIMENTGGFGIAAIDWIFKIMPALFVTVFILFGTLLIGLGITGFFIGNKKEDNDKNQIGE